jgi:hypothetical protein
MIVGKFNKSMTMKIDFKIRVGSQLFFKAFGKLLQLNRFINSGVQQALLRT